LGWEFGIENRREFEKEREKGIGFLLVLLMNIKINRKF